MISMVRKNASRVAASVFWLPRLRLMIAGAVAQHKAQRLDDGHQAGNDTHRAGSAGGDAPYKKGIGQIVDAGDEHTQDGGRGEAEDELRHRGLGHLLELERTARGLIGLGRGMHGLDTSLS